MRTIILATLLAFAAACGDDGNNTGPKDAAVDSPTTGGPDANCFDNPTTHYEIINACTTAQKIYKDSHPPLLHSDGTLPALP